MSAVQIATAPCGHAFRLTAIGARPKTYRLEFRKQDTSSMSPRRLNNSLVARSQAEPRML